MRSSPTLSTSEIVALSLDLLKHTLIPLATLGGVMIGITLAIQLGVTRMGVSLKKLTPDFKRLNPLSRLRELPKQNLPVVDAGRHHDSGLRRCCLLPGHGQLRKLSLAAPAQRAARRGPGRQLHPDPALEGLLRLPHLRRGGPAPPEAALSAGSEDEQAGHSRRVQGSGRQSADETAHPPHPPRYGAPAHDAGSAHRDRGDRESDALRGGLEIQHGQRQGAPKVVAKGKNYLALRIRQKAIENQVPLIENPPLAQALYKSVDVGQEIPAHFYRAVAEILAYIFKLMNGRRTA